MAEKVVIEEIERMFRLNPQYTRLGCLYNNRNKVICPCCNSSRNACKEMLEAFRYPPYS